MRLELAFPINWNLKMRFFVLPDKPTPDIVLDGRWMRAVRWKNELVPAVVYPESDRTLRFKGCEDIVNSVIRYLGLQDPGELYGFMEGDEVLRRLKQRFYGFGRAGMMSMTVYEGFIKAVIQQQISFLVAEKITARIVERFGEWIEFEGQRLYEFPHPETISSLSVEKLRDCGLSRRKAEVILEISRTALSFDFEKLRKWKESEVFEFLTSFKGVGRWTAELVMSMAIGMNVFPADDLGVRRAVSDLYFGGKLQSPETVRRVAEQKFGRFSRDVLFYLFLYDRMKSF